MLCAAADSAVQKVGGGPVLLLCRDNDVGCREMARSASARRIKIKLHNATPDQSQGRLSHQAQSSECAVSSPPSPRIGSLSSLLAPLTSQLWQPTCAITITPPKL